LRPQAYPTESSTSDLALSCLIPWPGMERGVLILSEPKQRISFSGKLCASACTLQRLDSSGLSPHTLVVHYTSSSACPKLTSPPALARHRSYFPVASKFSFQHQYGCR